MLSSNHPLWLPEGSIRAILALLLCCACIAQVFAGIDRGALTDAFLLVIGFYFGLKAKSPAPPQ